MKKHIKDYDKLKIYFLVFFMVCFMKCFSQTLMLKEKETNIPISYGSVFNNNTNKWLISDSVGKVVLEKSIKNVNLKISTTGYQLKNILVTIDTTIYLDRIVFELPEVIVKGNNFINKTYITKNGRMIKESSFRWNNENLIHFGTIISFNDTITRLKKITFSAKIEGNPYAKISRLKLYKLDNKLSNINNQIFNSGYKEIYSYDLRNTFHEPKEKYLTYYLPGNMFLENGLYLLCFQMIPNELDTIRLFGSYDEFAQSYYNFKNDYWIPYKSFGVNRFLNMRVKVEYQTNQQ